MRQSHARLIWVSLISAGFLAGLGAWIYQLTQGLIVSNMRNPVMWGLYITFFMFFVGLSAGGLIVASAGRLFGGHRLKPIVRLAVVEATVAVMLAALFLVPDLGRPDRLWHLFRYPHWTSPLMWDIAIVIIYLIISLLYVWVYTRADHAQLGSRLAFGTGTSEADSRRDERMKAVLAGVGLPAAVLLHSITAWIFGLQLSRGFWYTAIMAPLFISSALVSGTGLMILLSLVARRVKKITFSDELLGFLGKLLVTFIVVEAFLVFSDMLTAAYPGAEFEAGPMARLLSGRYAPFFWFEIGAGLLIPFVILVGGRRRFRPPWAAAAAALAVVGIWVHRFNLVLNGLSYATITEPPGVAIGTAPAPGTTSFALTQFYYPSWVEWIVALGLLCLGALLFTAAVVKLPLKEKASQHA